MRAKVVKNKVAPPFRVAEFDMMHTDGISYEGDILDLAMEEKLVVRSGAWFRYGDVQLGQGREKTREYLKENPALLEELRTKIIAARGYGGAPLKTAAVETGRRPGGRIGSRAGGVSHRTSCVECAGLGPARPRRSNREGKHGDA